MDHNQDRIPTWVGKAVTTAELSTLPALTEPKARENKQNEPERPEHGSRPEEPIHVGDFEQADLADDGSERLHHRASGPVDGRSSPPRWRSAALIGMTVAALLLVAAAVVLPRAGDDDSSGIAADGDVSDEQDPAGPEQRAAADADFGAASSMLSEFSETSNNRSRAIEDGTGPVNDEDPRAADGTAAEFSIPGVSAAAMDFHRKTALADGQSAWAVYSDGRIYLQGTLPDRTVADLLTSRLQALLGDRSVVEQFTIEEPGIAPTDPPLFIKETVVFAPESADMPPGSDWILVIADVLMNRYPATSLTVVANGSDAGAGITAELQRQRTQAIIDYLLERGIDESRLGFQYRDEGTFGGDTGNKPIEFVVHGLVDAATGMGRTDG